MRVRAVTFDAGGTLFEPVRPVGETYAAVALRHGCATHPGRLHARFQEAWSRHSAASRPTGSAAVTPADEKAWWKGLTAEIFSPFGGFRDFDAFFEELHATFAEPDHWHVFPEVPAALARLQGAGIRLAIISNWDGRLEALCTRLGLRGQFEIVVASGSAGVSKPDAAVFRMTLAGLGVAPAETVHVGDSLRDDIHGALGAGLGALWVKRNGASGEAPAGVPVVGNLEEAVALVLS